MNCKEPEYQTLKEALKLNNKYLELKELISFRFNYVNELSEDQVSILNEIRVNENNEDDDDDENEDNIEEKTEGFSKENLLKRLKVDLEQIEKILYDLGMKEDDFGEIDGGGDDGGGKVSSTNDDDDDDEFQDAR